MSASVSLRTWLAIAFVVAMLGLGSLNPNGAVGGGGCGLSCGDRSLALDRF